MLPLQLLAHLPDLDWLEWEGRLDGLGMVRGKEKWLLGNGYRGRGLAASLLDNSTYIHTHIKGWVWERNRSGFDLEELYIPLFSSLVQRKRLLN